MNKKRSDADGSDGCHIPGHQIWLLGLSWLDPYEQNCPVTEPPLPLPLSEILTS